MILVAIKQDENASTDLVDFLGNWVEVEEKARFGEVGSYEVTITRYFSLVLKLYQTPSGK